MLSIVKQLSFKLFTVCLCLLFIIGCTHQSIDDKLYLQNIENPNSDEKSFQIDEDFDYSQIVFKLYFTENSNEWQLVETYKFDKDNSNVFTTGYNPWALDYILFSDNQLCLIYGNKEYKHKAIELKNYEKEDGYNGCGGYFLEKKELSYNNEIPFHMKIFSKSSYENKEVYSIPHNWEDYKIENMKITNSFNCEGYSCYVYTVQLIP